MNTEAYRTGSRKPKKASRKPPGSYKKFQGRNPEIISLLFWDKLIFHKDITFTISMQCLGLYNIQFTFQQQNYSANCSDIDIILNIYSYFSDASGGNNLIKQCLSTRLLCHCKLQFRICSGDFDANWRFRHLVLTLILE